MRLRDPYITSDLSQDFARATLHLSVTLQNPGDKPVTGELAGSITGDGRTVDFSLACLADCAG